MTMSSDQNMPVDFDPADMLLEQPDALLGIDVEEDADALLSMIESQPVVTQKIMPATGACAIASPSFSRDFTTHFGLEDSPFQDSINPDYFYKTSTHEKAYLRVMMSIEYDISLSLVTGTSGTGKTMLSQMILQTLSNRSSCHPIIVLVSPRMSKTALLKEILGELEIELPVGRCSAHDLLRLISDRVIELYQQGKKLVIFIDECHFLTSDALHTLRTLTNIEVPEHKLMTCVMFGEPAFLKRLEKPGYESLRSRIYARGELETLTAQECRQYIKYRVLMAGGGEDLFDEMALDAIHYCSGGICRQINKICMIAMLEAYMQGSKMVDATVVGMSAGQI